MSSEPQPQQPAPAQGATQRGEDDASKGPAKPQPPPLRSGWADLLKKNAAGGDGAPSSSPAASAAGGPKG